MCKQTVTSPPQQHHQIGDGIDVDGELVEIESALNRIARAYRLDFNSNQLDLLKRLRDAMQHVQKYLQHEQALHPFKYYLTLATQFFKAVDVTIVTDPPVVFSSETAILLAATDISEQLDIVYQQRCHQIGTYESQGSC